MLQSTRLSGYPLLAALVAWVLVFVLAGCAGSAPADPEAPPLKSSRPLRTRRMPRRATTTSTAALIRMSG
jgi:hypothetical protein